MDPCVTSRRSSLASRLRRDARRSLLLSHVAEDPPQALQTPRVRRRARAGWLPGDDDSSQEDDGIQLGWRHALDELRTSEVSLAHRIGFSARGIHLHLPSLKGYKGRIVPLSTCVALRFAEGVAPGACVGLQSGRLARWAAACDYQLQSAAEAQGWLLVADSRAFFNFVLRRWQPLSLAKGAYSTVRELVYVAFTPARNAGPAGGGPALFVKLGYREIQEDEDGDYAALIGYVEKKSRRLQLTNVEGAGIFIFSAPESHGVFARPCRAAEASLKTELLHSEEVLVTPSGHLGDVGAFSASLEYLFVEAPPGSSQLPLQALTQLLRSFTGDLALSPQLCSTASDGGSIRRGRKRLRPWPQQLAARRKSIGAEHLASPQRPAGLAAAVPASRNRPVLALRSRAKIALMESGRRALVMPGLKGNTGSVNRRSV